MRAWLAAASLLVTACGSDDSGPPRSQFDGGGAAGGVDGSGLPVLECDQTPCGGDLVGTWKNQKLCSVNDVFGEVDAETYAPNGDYHSTNKDGLGARFGKWVASGTTATITLTDQTEYSIDYCRTDKVLWTRYSPTTAIVLVLE